MKIYQVDAFTTQPFHGNPACVCLLEQEQPAEWMQALSAEMNLSETAFLLKQADGYNLRWFTPKKEVTLCGHATLATAHILWSEGYLAPEETANFDTLSGRLTARLNQGWIELDFPARSVTAAEPNPVLNAALGVSPLQTSKNSLPAGEYYLLELDSEASLRQLKPDFSHPILQQVRAVIVTCRAENPGYDFVSRYFAPAIGINEDPVTGSAHCYLAPYWTKKLGKTALTGFQASARGGSVGCEWQQERVILRGQAITVFQGELKI